MPDPVLTPRAWIRAALITLALVVHGIYAAPLPSRVTRADLDSAEGREEVDRWMTFVEGAGIPLTRAQIEETTMAWTGALADLHKALRAPFYDALKLTGTGQAWALFASPDSHPHRLEVYVEEGGVWRPIYRRNHPGLAWRDATFRFRRVRGLYDGSTGKSRVEYWNFTRWVAREALLDFPNATAVRVQMVRTHTVLPWETPDPRETARQVHTHKRTAILPDDGLAP